MNKIVMLLAMVIGTIAGLAMRVFDWLTGKRKDFWSERK